MIEDPQSKIELFQIGVIGFGISLLILAIILTIFVGNLGMGLICIVFGFFIISQSIPVSKESQSKDQREHKDIDHALALSRSIHRGDEGGMI
jgi:hypothetical protein